MLAFAAFHYTTPRYSCPSPDLPSPKHPSRTPVAGPPVAVTPAEDARHRIVLGEFFRRLRFLFLPTACVEVMCAVCGRRTDPLYSVLPLTRPTCRSTAQNYLSAVLSFSDFLSCRIGDPVLAS